MIKDHFWYDLKWCQGLNAVSVSSKAFLEFKNEGETFSFLSECLKCLTPEHTIQNNETKIPNEMIPIEILVM